MNDKNFLKDEDIKIESLKVGAIGYPASDSNQLPSANFSFKIENKLSGEKLEIRLANNHFRIGNDQASIERLLKNSHIPRPYEEDFLFNLHRIYKSEIEKFIKDTYKYLFEKDPNKIPEIWNITGEVTKEGNIILDLIGKK